MGPTVSHELGDLRRFCHTTEKRLKTLLDEMAVMTVNARQMLAKVKKVRRHASKPR